LINWYKTFVAEIKIFINSYNSVWTQNIKILLPDIWKHPSKWNNSVTTRLRQKKLDTSKKNRSSKIWNLDFFLSYQRRFQVYIKYIKVNKWYWLTHYHDDQMLTSRLWAYLHTESVTWLNTIVENLWRFWYFKKKKCWIST
jgi:hypothetical protein